MPNRGSGHVVRVIFVDHEFHLVANSNSSNILFGRSIYDLPANVDEQHIREYENETISLLESYPY